MKGLKGKRILLIHPLGVNWTPGEQDMSRIANIMAPLGLISIAAWLEHHGHEVSVHDCYAFPGRDELIFAQVRNERPDYAGFSTTTSSFLDGVRIALKIKEISPKTRIVFGGVHLSALREKLLRDYPVIDYGVAGEGEQAFLELIENEGGDLQQIGGLIYRSGDVHFAGARTRLLDLDSLPFPAYEKLPGYPDSYLLPIFNYPKAPNTTIITSRGCPFHCSYCDRSVFGQTYRTNSPPYMVDLLKHLNQRFKIKHVNIYDDVFTLNRTRTLEFSELKIRSGPKVTFNCAARAEQIDMEMLKLLKRAGCWMISLGIETGDPGLLKLHRTIVGSRTPEEQLDLVREKVDLIKKAGIRAKGLFMLGLPGETDESIDRSMKYAFSLPLDEFNLSKLTPFPGAPMYQGIEKWGTFNEKWELMNALTFIFIPRGFTRERLEERYHEFYRRYFKRPRVIWNYAKMIYYSPQSWLRFLANLVQFLTFARSYRKKKT